MSTTLSSPKGNPVSVSNKRASNKSSSINKASSEKEAVSRLQLGALGYNGLRISSGIDGASVATETIHDLQWPRCLDVFSAMEKDAAVKVALELKTNLILKALKNMDIVPQNKDDKKEQDAAEFLKWNLHNLVDQSFIDVVTNICTYNRDGFSILEKVYKQQTVGEYSGKIVLKKLAPRAQRSLDMSEPWRFSKDGRDFLGVQQSTDSLDGRYSFAFKDLSSNKVFLPAKKLMMFSWGSENGDPSGNSPLKSCFVAFKEKKLLEELQVVGSSKNLSGTPVLNLPTDFLNKAAANPASGEGVAMRQLSDNVASMHKGHQTHMIMPSDRDERGNPLFSLKFLGVEGGSGGNNAADLAEAINRRKQAILDSFGAGFLNLGNDGSGSYALMDGKTSVHEAFIERDIMFIISVFENQLFPQLLALNGIRLPYNKMPRMKAGSLNDIDVDTSSKAIQRTMAVKGIPVTAETINENLRKLGYEYQLPVDMSQEDLKEVLMLGDNSVRTRSGDGMTSGLSNGVGDASQGGDASISNTENGGS